MHITNELQFLLVFTLESVITSGIYLIKRVNKVLAFLRLWLTLSINFINEVNHRLVIANNIGRNPTELLGDEKQITRSASSYLNLSFILLVERERISKAISGYKLLVCLLLFIVHDLNYP